MPPEATRRDTPEQKPGLFGVYQIPAARMPGVYRVRKTWYFFDVGKCLARCGLLGGGGVAGGAIPVRRGAIVGILWKGFPGSSRFSLTSFQALFD